ncbi:MAG TPA: triose-phosphate isomerase [Patescibacteria group bacterium]|nr:triose-phosphate isomerase [Patescibacteria group bacterium]
MKYLIANWKMNLGIKESVELSKKIADEMKSSFAKASADKENISIVLCPSFTALAEVSNTIKKSSLKLGAQDIFWVNKGAFTGEISAQELKEAGAEFVIIGHSERRHIVGETDEVIAKKMKLAADFNLRPILCVGETQQERENEQAEKRAAEQLELGLQLLDNAQMAKILIAYEPVWAIGTGKACSSDDALSMLVLIKKSLQEKFSENNIPILYGGSTDDKNIASYIEVGYSGALVGGSSLKPLTFLKMREAI